MFRIISSICIASLMICNFIELAKIENKIDKLEKGICLYA